MNIKKLVLILVISSLAFVVSAQAKEDFVVKTDSMSVKKDSVQEWVLDSAMKRLVLCENHKIQKLMNDTIFEYFVSVLDTSAFAPTFDSQRFGRILSSDKAFCIYSWNYFNRREGMLVNMIIQTANGKLYKLKKVHTRVPNVLGCISLEDWYGALYYKAEKFTMQKNDYYLLLGWTKYDLKTQIKVVDVLTFDNDTLNFGAPMFEKELKGHNVMGEENNQTLHSRLLFRYDWQVQMTLDYEPENKRIVFDHLSPMESSYPFVEPRYAPDMSVDAYEMKSKSWKYKEDINIKNK